MLNTNSPTTLADVAKLAGVSKSAASRALSGKNRPISIDKKNRVLEAAATLGYIANPFAQSLSSNETGLIAIIVNHIADVSDLQLFDLLIQGIQSIGKQAILVRLKSPDDIDALQKNSFVQRVDAALVFSDFIEPSLTSSLFYTDIVIMLNGKSQNDGYSVKINEEIGIKDTVEYAHSMGIQKAVLIAGRESSANEKQRIEHYLAKFKAHNIQLIDSIFCNYSYDEALDYLRASEGFNDSNTGVFCTSDSMAMAAIDYFHSHKIMNSQCIFGFDKTEFHQRGNYQFSTIGYDKNKLVQAIITIIEQVQAAKINVIETDMIENKKWLSLEESHLVIETQFYLNNNAKR